MKRKIRIVTIGNPWSLSTPMENRRYISSEIRHSLTTWLNLSFKQLDIYFNYFDTEWNTKNMLTKYEKKVNSYFEKIVIELNLTTILQKVNSKYHIKTHLYSKQSHKLSSFIIISWQREPKKATFRYK